MQHLLGSSLDITCFRHPDSGDVAKKSEQSSFCVVDYIPVNGVMFCFANPQCRVSLQQILMPSQKGYPPLEIHTENHRHLEYGKLV